VPFKNLGDTVQNSEKPGLIVQPGFKIFIVATMVAEIIRGLCQL